MQHLNKFRSYHHKRMKVLFGYLKFSSVTMIWNYRVFILSNIMHVWHLIDNYCQLITLLLQQLL